MNRTAIAALALTLAMPVSPANAASSACKQASFIFGKMSVAAINCNFQEKDAMPALSLFLDLREYACPGQKNGDPAATKEGGMNFFNETRTGGKAQVCDRIFGELISLRKKDNAVRGNDTLSGYWVIVGSVPLVDGAKPHNNIRATAARCHIPVYSDFSNKFGFEPRYMAFVISENRFIGDGMFKTAAAAEKKANEVRRCFPDAYIKRGNEPGE